MECAERQVGQFTVRVGLPQRGGALLQAARASNLPILISANAFAKYTRDGRFVRFVLPKPGTFDGLSVALDSAGYVAMKVYGSYMWSVQEYVRLAASAPFAFWSSMDMCTEQGVAPDRATRRLRIAGTVRGYVECRREGRYIGLKDPMPVLQGRAPEEYVACADAHAFTDSEWPDLVGVGSVCRRPLHGPDGLARIIDALHVHLPRHVRLHLFGVKSGAVELYARHPRVASCDSCSWDAIARRKRPTGRTQAFRASEMLAWKTRQDERAQLARGAQFALFGAEAARPGDSAYDVLLEEWADLVESGEIDYQSARVHALRDLAYRSCAPGSAPRRDEDEDDLLPMY